MYSLPEFYSTFMLTSTDEEPKSFREEFNSIEGKLWKDDMIEKIESLHKNETWDLVELPNGRKDIGSKWEFKKNMNTVGQVDKFKARLAVNGYSQVKGVEFSDIFSHVAKLTSITVLMYLFVEFDLDIE
jgi:hypothetical protein